jgi:hypothetical protein
VLFVRVDCLLVLFVYCNSDDVLFVCIVAHNHHNRNYDDVAVTDISLEVHSLFHFSHTNLFTLSVFIFNN